jgi:hypothetical protein
MKVIIYKITSPSKKIYIGQVQENKGLNARWRQHVNSAKNNPKKGSSCLNSAILKYGEQSFIKEVLCVIDYNIKDVTEQFCISYFKSMVPNGYNLQSGGTHTTHSNETIIKRSNSLKELLKCPEKRQIWSKAKKGVPQNNKKNRKYEEDYNLPKYVRRIRGRYEGYCIDSHPLCKCKKIQSIKLTMEEKYKITIDILNELNNNMMLRKIQN